MKEVRKEVTTGVIVGIVLAALGAIWALATDKWPLLWKYLWEDVMFDVPRLYVILAAVGVVGLWALAAYVTRIVVTRSRTVRTVSTKKKHELVVNGAEWRIDEALLNVDDTDFFSSPYSYSHLIDGPMCRTCSELLTKEQVSGLTYRRHEDWVVVSRCPQCQTPHDYPDGQPLSEVFKLIFREAKRQRRVRQI